MPGTPEVCVPVPPSNDLRFLPTATEWCLRQGFPPYEVIPSDDASTEGSADLVRARVAPA